MNKVSLLTIGKKLSDGNSYLLSIYDIEPSGVIVHAYDQQKSKELILPISEAELAHAGFARNILSLTSLIESIDIVPQGADFVLQSSNEDISNIKKRATGAELEAMVKAPMPNCPESIQDVLVTGLVELCKVKPVGVDAVEWLGNWLLNNNPPQPSGNP
eukprot:CAMPEP_0173346386 /NCGR_PEP_ID=MMETSP1144-20121109/12534_1 /TAXON_ID=483371 /ORGANISM="non described non described, Strain CCMP2298" /LENGTH=158 /DNA_ID=CAMNT_0014293685 /DNA_START=29 /DNA_END=501 /DNA_ORIENTATION=+